MRGVCVECNPSHVALLQGAPSEFTAHQGIAQFFQAYLIHNERQILSKSCCPLSFLE